MNLSSTFSIVAGSLLSIAALPIVAQPSILFTTPARNQIDVNRGSSATVFFTQPLNLGSTSALRVFSSQRGGMRAGHSGNISINSQELTFTPRFTFKPGEVVQMTVTNAAQSSSGALLVPAVFQFTAAVTGGNASFINGADVAANYNPYNVTAADIDGDGDLDLLSPTFNSNSVRINLNNGNGLYSNVIDVPVGQQPRSVVCADLDSDGDLDIVTANYNSNTASVRFNNGLGTFSGGMEINVGSQPQSVNTADIDADGDLDILKLFRK